MSALDRLQFVRLCLKVKTHSSQVKKKNAHICKMLRNNFLNNIYENNVFQILTLKYSKYFARHCKIRRRG